MSAPSGKSDGYGLLGGVVVTFGGVIWLMYEWGLVIGTVSGAFVILVLLYLTARKDWDAYHDVTPKIWGLVVCGLFVIFFAVVLIEDEKAHKQKVAIQIANKQVAIATTTAIARWERVMSESKKVNFVLPAHGTYTIERPNGIRCHVINRPKDMNESIVLLSDTSQKVTYKSLLANEKKLTALFYDAGGVCNEDAHSLKKVGLLK